MVGKNLLHSCSCPLRCEGRAALTHSDKGASPFFLLWFLFSHFEEGQVMVSALDQGGTFLGP